MQLFDIPSMAVMGKITTKLRAVAVAQVVERRTPQAIFKACVSSKLTYGSAAFV